MSWGALYWYYECPKCGKLFKYATDLMSDFGEDFGKCPVCDEMGTFITEGARIPEDLKYEEIE